MKQTGKHYRYRIGMVLLSILVVGIAAHFRGQEVQAPEKQDALIADRQSAKQVQSDAAVPLSQKYPNANDRMVYLLLENGTLEQWSLDGSYCQHFSMPEAEEEYSADQLVWVGNEELIWYAEEEDDEGNYDYDKQHVYSTPIEQTESGEEPNFTETKELYVCNDDDQGIRGVDSDFTFWRGGTVYADDRNLAYLRGETLYVYDRKSGGKPTAVSSEDRHARYSGDYLPSMVIGDQIVYHTGSEPGRIEEERYGFYVYNRSSLETQNIDDRCFTNAAYVADPSQDKVYYQIIEDQSIWEYDLQTKEHRELISEQEFQRCYAENHLVWDDAYYDDSLFVDGDRLYLIKNQTVPRIFSYTFAGSGLRYEEKLTSAVWRSGYVEQAQRDKVYLGIAEGKLLLRWQVDEDEEDEDDEEQEGLFDRLLSGIRESLSGEYEDTQYFICIDLETAEGKAVTDRDPERVYFGMLGLWQKPGTTGRWEMHKSEQVTAQTNLDQTGQETSESGQASPEPGQSGQASPEPGQSEAGLPSLSDPIPIKDQLACISRHADIWLQIDDEFDEVPMSYCAVTDLDHNGRLELIVTSAPQGSGCFTTTEYYQVSADGNDLRRIINCAPDIDILDDIDTVYVDTDTDAYYYLAYDYVSGGYGARYRWDGGVILRNGMLTGRTYAERETELDASGDEIWYLHTYLNGKHKKRKMKEKELEKGGLKEKLAEKFFAGYEKRSVNIEWKHLKSGKNLTQEKIYQKLSQSYQGFRVE